MTGEELDIVKACFDMLKGDVEVNNIFPFVGQGHNPSPGKGPAMANMAAKIGVTKYDFKMRVLDPKQNKLSKWNYKQQPEKIASMVADPERLKGAPPILVHALPAGGYEVIDGGHRNTAATQLSLPIQCIVVSDKGYQAMVKAGFKDYEMYRTGQYYYDKGVITQ